MCIRDSHHGAALGEEARGEQRRHDELHSAPHAVNPDSGTELRTGGSLTFTVLKSLAVCGYVTGNGRYVGQRRHTRVD
eukprot:4830994-Prymnesium_polylepis.1